MGQHTGQNRGQRSGRWKKLKMQKETNLRFSSGIRGKLPDFSRYGMTVRK
jgi:hypothetical protein